MFKALDETLNFSFKNNIKVRLDLCIDLVLKKIKVSKKFLNRYPKIKMLIILTIRINDFIK